MRRSWQCPRAGAIIEGCSTGSMRLGDVPPLESKGSGYFSWRGGCYAIWQWWRRRCGTNFGHHLCRLGNLGEQPASAGTRSDRPARRDGCVCRVADADQCLASPGPAGGGSDRRSTTRKSDPTAGDVSRSRTRRRRDHVDLWRARGRRSGASVSLRPMARRRCGMRCAKRSGSAWASTCRLVPAGGRAGRA